VRSSRIRLLGPHTRQSTLRVRPPILARLFEDPSRTLWKGLSGGDLSDVGQQRAEVEEAGEGGAVALLRGLVEELAADFPGTPEARFVRDEVLALMAVDVVTGNHDAYTTRANNWTLYRQPATNTWHLLPWGADQASCASWIHWTPPRRSRARSPAGSGLE